jgi:hypothetical protein
VDEASDYSTQCLLYWESEDHASKANKDSGEILADIKNYTDTHPIIFGGAVTASG